MSVFCVGRVSGNHCRIGRDAFRCLSATGHAARRRRKLESQPGKVAYQKIKIIIINEYFTGRGGGLF